jgi:ribosomal protein L37AE/L43A
MSKQAPKCHKCNKDCSIAGTPRVGSELNIWKCFNCGYTVEEIEYTDIDQAIKMSKDTTCKFAMWFIVNWEFYDDTDKGQTYRSMYDGKTTLPIDEIYDRWLLNDI